MPAVPLTVVAPLVVFASVAITVGVWAALSLVVRPSAESLWWTQAVAVSAGALFATAAMLLTRDHGFIITGMAGTFGYATMVFLLHAYTPSQVLDGARHTDIAGQELFVMLYNKKAVDMHAGLPRINRKILEGFYLGLGITEPTTVMPLVDKLDKVPADRPFPSVKWAGYAAFNASLDDIAESAERRGLLLCGLYGMSEVQALYSLQPIDSEVARRKKGGGVPTSPLAHVRVRDPETGELLGVGQPGALECAGPSLMVGYYGDDKATAETVTADGYVRTGDLAELDGHGGFTFLSRMGDVLRLSGFLVNPLEIETHLQKLPGITGCQAVAVPRPDGVRAVAFVILAPGATLDETAAIAHCKHGLANYKVPVRIFALDDFPKTPSPNGFKIQRARLRDMAVARL